MADDRRQTKSKYTTDRQIPGAFEGETITRRRLMTGTANVAGAVAASAFLLPALGFALGPVFEKKDELWQAVGPPEDFLETTYVPKVITIVAGIGAGGQDDHLRPQAQREGRHRQARPVQPVRRDLHALHAPRLPGAVRGGGRALHLPVPRRRLRLHGQGRRRPAGAPARPLLHTRGQRPGRDRPALLGQHRARALLARAIPASRWTASASTCTRRGPRSASSRGRRSCPSFRSHHRPRSSVRGPRAPARATARPSASDGAEAGTTADRLDRRAHVAVRRRRAG